MKLPLVIPLPELSSDRIVRRVGLDLVQLPGVWQQKHRIRDDEIVDPLECLLLFRSLLKLNILLRHIVQRSYDVAKVLNKHPVEVGESDESLDLYRVC